jgi:hypothetical protein
MLLSISCGLGIGAVVLTVLKMPTSSKSVLASEESAHSTAADKRVTAINSRREARYQSERPASVALLGDSSRQSACRIVNVSRSGMRITSTRNFPKGSQVCVQWGDEFFVGAVLYTLPEQGQYVAGLELVSGNFHWHPLGRLCFWRRSA